MVQLLCRLGDLFQRLESCRRARGWPRPRAASMRCREFMQAGLAGQKHPTRSLGWQTSRFGSDPGKTYI